METEHRTLLLSPRYDEDSQLLWQVALKRTWRVERLDGYRVRDGQRGYFNARACIYGGHIWGEEIARQLGIALAMPPVDWLATLPREFTGRAIDAVTLASVGQFEQSSFPLFVKPRDWPQSFASRIYRSRADLPAADPMTPVLVAEPVMFAREFRAFILDHEIVAFSPYSRGPEGAFDAQLSNADVPIAQRCRGWLSDALTHFDTLPRAVVIDVGVLVLSGEVVIVEANPAWCSGMYRCDPDKVLDVVAAASEQAGA